MAAAPVKCIDLNYKKIDMYLLRRKASYSQPQNQNSSCPHIPLLGMYKCLKSISIYVYKLYPHFSCIYL